MPLLPNISRRWPSRRSPQFNPSRNGKGLLLKIRFGAALAATALLAACTTQTPAPPVRVAAAPVEVQSPYRWTNGYSDKARGAAFTAFGPTNLKPGEFLWAEKVPAEGEARIVVDLLTQMAYVYRGEAVVGITTISSGKKGKETPLGFWSVLRKQKNYRSRKYQNAPMPFAQIIDDHGIAFHGGAIPGYPASHGCVRVPVKFAERLFGVTKLGTKVVIEG